MKPLRFFRYGKVYIIPTYNGLALLGLLMLTIICAVSSGNNLLYLMSILLGLFTMITMFAAHSNIRGLTVNQIICEPQAAHRDFSCSFQVQNDDDVPRHNVRIALPGFKNHITTPYQPGGPDIPQSLQTVQLDYRGHPRGVYEFDRVKFFSSFPFGLWRVWMWTPALGEIVLYPTPKGVQNLPVTIHANERGSKSHNGGGEDFSELRTYSAGESPYHIDWHSLARGRGALVKRFDSGGSDQAFVALEAVQVKEFEQQLSQLSQWLLTCREQGIPFVFKLGTHSQLQLSGSSQELMFNRCLRELANLQQRGSNV